MDLEKVVAHYGAEAMEFHRVSNQVESRLIALQQRFASAAVGGGLFGGFVGAGAAVAAVAAITAVEVPIRLLERGVRDVVSVTSQAIDTAIQLGMEWERSSISFEVMTQNAERGRQVLGDLQQLAIETPYRTRQMTRFGEILLGYGVPSGDIVPTLARLGDVAGGSTVKFERLALAFGQVVSAGRFMGQEKRQFAEAGVGLEDFAKTAGMSGAQFRQAMEEGQIGADVVIKTINRLTNEGGRFFGLSQRVNLQTVMGQWDSFMERLERTGRRIFASDPSIGSRGLFERFGVAEFIGDLGNQLDSLDTKINPFLDRFEAWLRRAGTGLSPLADTVDILADRFTKWAKAGEEMLPTWEKIGQVIDDFNKNKLPGILDWVERNAKAVGEWATQFAELGKNVTGAMDRLEELSKKGQGKGLSSAPGEISGAALDAMKTANELGKLSGLQGEQVRQEAWNRLEASKLGSPFQDPKIALMGDIAKRSSEELAQIQSGNASLVGSQAAVAGAAAVANLYPHYMRSMEALRSLHPDIRAVGQAAVGAAAGANAPLTMNDQKLAMALAFGMARAGLPGTGTGGGWDEISPFARGFNPTQEQHRVLRELDKYLPGEALSDYGKFQERLRILAGLRYNVGGVSDPVGAVVGIMGGMAPQITEEKYRRGVFDAYEDLEKKFGKAASVQLAPAAKLGSQEAMDTFNRSLVELTSPIDRLASVMNEAQLTAASLDKTIKEIMPSLLNMAANAGVVIGRNP